MIRLLLILSALLTCLALSAAEGDSWPVQVPDAAQPSKTVTETRTVDQWVETFHPDLLQTEIGADGKPDGKRVHWHMETPFGDAPATDIAADVQDATLFTALVFLPFLILPQVLLVYIMFRFRDRRDGRPAATFTTNHKLEVIWTAIPFVAVLVVSVPSAPVLWKMLSPPKQQDTTAMHIQVTGRRYVWDYDYLKLGGEKPQPAGYKPIRIGSGIPLIPEPLVLVKGRPASLAITSGDVNHAWWIPAFGTKQDAIAGRYTDLWFTPLRTGFYKGQCAELCGRDHGIMLISAKVVEESEFDVWLKLMGHREDVQRVWSAVKGKAVDDKELREAVQEFFAKDGGAERRFALRYWLATNFAYYIRDPEKNGAFAQTTEVAKTRRAQVEQLIAAVPAATRQEKP